MTDGRDKTNQERESGILALDFIGGDYKDLDYLDSLDGLETLEALDILDILDGLCRGH